MDLTDVNLINSYLARAREIIGERTEGEIRYDRAVVAHLAAGMGIKEAIKAANEQDPEESLKPGPEDWEDLAVRYDYLKEHSVILKRLGMKE